MNNIKHGTRAQDIGASLDQRFDSIKARVIGAKDDALTRGNRYLDRTTDLIKERPLEAVAIAFVIGYLGMRLIRR